MPLCSRFAGYVLDVLGTKISYAFFAIAWAVFCGSTALAGSWAAWRWPAAPSAQRSGNDPLPV